MHGESPKNPPNFYGILENPPTSAPNLPALPSRRHAPCTKGHGPCGCPPLLGEHRRHRTDVLPNVAFGFPQKVCSDVGVNVLNKRQHQRQCVAPLLGCPGFFARYRQLWGSSLHAFETGCRCRVLVLPVGLVLGAVSWLCAWWKQGAGAGCRCRVLVEIGCRCRVLVLYCTAAFFPV